MVVLRDGRRVPITVTLAERKEDLVASANQPTEPAVAEALGGVKVRELTADERANSKVQAGVMVTDVEEGSPADEAGLQPNDVIEEVAAKPVMSAAGFTKLLRDAKTANKPAVLLVHRGSDTQYIALRLGS